MVAASLRYLLARLKLCFFRKSSSSPCSVRFFLKDFFLTRGTLRRVFADRWFGGGREIGQGLCPWGAAETLEGTGSWPKRGRTEEASRRDARPHTAWPRDGAGVQTTSAVLAPEQGSVTEKGKET